jgi:hypothetical protein
LAGQPSSALRYEFTVGGRQSWVSVSTVPGGWRRASPKQLTTGD